MVKKIEKARRNDGRKGEMLQDGSESVFGGESATSREKIPFGCSIASRRVFETTSNDFYYLLKIRIGAARSQLRRNRREIHEFHPPPPGHVPGNLFMLFSTVPTAFRAFRRGERISATLCCFPKEKRNKIVLLAGQHFRLAAGLLFADTRAGSAPADG